jgi:hypothetical protein
LHAAQKLHVSTVRLAGAVTDPQHMGRTGVPLARQAIDPGERLLVIQEQGLVAGVKVRLAQLADRLARQAASGHEGHGLVDPR